MTNNKRTLTGTVVSDSMNKTVVVSVELVKQHTKYRKKYKTTKKYKVHDEENVHTLGDIVEFEESRPLSRDKRWRIIPSKQS